MIRIKNKFNQIIKNEKDLLILKNMFGAVIVKGGALFISLYTMPAYIRYFDNQLALGLWFTILSVMSWILTFDFGIGNGLRNKIVESFVKNDRKETKEYISSAYVIISVLVIVLVTIGIAFSEYVDWNKIFNISQYIISKKTMLFAIRCVFAGVMLQFLLRLITSILYAMQKSALNNLLSLVTSILQLIFVLFTPSYDIESNLKILSLFYIASVNIPLLFATFVVFNTELKGCAPSIRFFDFDKSKSVLSLGGVFFWSQIMYMFITVTNEFFISQFYGPEFVVEYQIYNRLFTVIGSLFMLALTPMWSAITKALNEGDSTWIAKIYKSLNYMTLLAVCFEILIIPALQFIIDLWLGKSAIRVDYMYAVIFAIYGSLFIYQSVLSTIVCGMGKMKLQAVCYTLGVISKFFIIYYGSMILKSWIVVVLANSIILLPYCILQPYYIKRDIKNLSRT